MPALRITHENPLQLLHHGSFFTILTQHSVLTLVAFQTLDRLLMIIQFGGYFTR